MGDDDRLATPFEMWCEASGIDPDDPDAWALFERQSLTERLGA